MIISTMGTDTLVLSGDDEDSNPVCSCAQTHAASVHLKPPSITDKL